MLPSPDILSAIYVLPEHHLQNSCQIAAFACRQILFHWRASFILVTIHIIAISVSRCTTNGLNFPMHLLPETHDICGTPNSFCYFGLQKIEEHGRLFDTKTLFNIVAVSVHLGDCREIFIRRWHRFLPRTLRCHRLTVLSSVLGRAVLHFRSRHSHF